MGKGISRFFVIERGELDGYSTALIRPFTEDAQGFPASAAFSREAMALRDGLKSFQSAIMQMGPGAGMVERLEHQLGALPAPDAPQFNAHMSFYAAQLISAFNGGDGDAADLVFLQPEADRWKRLLRACKKMPHVGEHLRAVEQDSQDDQSDPDERSSEHSGNEVAETHPLPG